MAVVWSELRTQKEWRDNLQRLLRENDQAVLRAIWVIYSRQTVEEQMTGRSTEDNGRGFSKIDAEFFSKIVVQVRAGRPLSPKQMAIARNKMGKYWRQLMEESKVKMEQEKGANNA